MSEVKDFASADVSMGRANAVIKKLMSQRGPNAVAEFLRGEVVCVEKKHRWYERDGIIHLSFTIGGIDGRSLVLELREKGIMIDGDTERIIRSDDFGLTRGLQEAKVVIIKRKLFGRDCLLPDVRAFAAEKGFQTPKAETICRFCKLFPIGEFESMGLSWIYAMHEPIKDGLLYAAYTEDGLYLHACTSDPCYLEENGGGFLFVTPC